MLSSAVTTATSNSTPGIRARGGNQQHIYVARFCLRIPTSNFEICPIGYGSSVGLGLSVLAPINFLCWLARPRDRRIVKTNQASWMSWPRGRHVGGEVSCWKFRSSWRC